MKTHILPLDEHDDITSALDKMGWGKSERILLVWPKKGRILTRRLDLVLLRRRSADLGAQLAIVCRDGRVRFHARTLGIPVYASLEKARGSHWRSLRFTHYPPLPHKAEIQQARHLSGRQVEFQPRPPATGKTLPAAVRFLVFTVGVLAVLSIAVVLIPAATIDLVRQVQTQESSFVVRADPAARAPDLSGTLPIRLVQVVVEGRDQIQTSGSVLVPDRPASGEILFTNLTTRRVVIPPGTVVATLDPQPVRFTTLITGELQAGLQYSTTVPIQALTLGSRGNLLPRRLKAVIGSLGTEVAVVNPASTTGGRNRQDRAPTVEDAQELKQKLLTSLQDTALTEFKNMFDPQDLPLPSTLQLTRILVENFSPPTGQPADHLELQMRLEFQAQVVSGKDLRALALAILDTNLPAGFETLSREVELEILEVPQPDANQVITWKVRAWRPIQALVMPEKVTGLILGLSAASAEKRLAALPLQEPARIRLTPSWWPHLPVIPFRIEMKLADPSLSR